MTPTRLTLRRLREEGWVCQVVEYWNPFSRTRKDLFGCIDILAVKGERTLGVQCTSNAHVAERLRKARESEELKAWLEAGNEFQVWGWSKRAERTERALGRRKKGRGRGGGRQRGKGRKRWVLRVVPLSLPPSNPV
jgi:hypothetical protein